MNELTPIQARVLLFIKSHISSQGSAPTRIEIANHFGWQSANAAEEHLKRLAREGAIRLTPGISRGISLVTGGVSALPPDSDAEIFTRAVVAGVARWEFFSGSDIKGEVCVGGLRYATRLDVGIPILGAVLRAALERYTVLRKPQPLPAEPIAHILPHGDSL